MPLPPLQPVNDDRVSVSGDVTIHPTAVLAMGVILQAQDNARIVIGAGVCLGMGVILHATDRTLEIGAGANLGAGVLVVGTSLIGANACIGAATTIFNASVESQQVISPGSLIGDTSRRVHHSLDSNETTAEVSETEPLSKGAIPAVEESEGRSEAESAPVEAETPSEGSQPDSSPPKSIYGQVHVHRILTTLFPYNPSQSRGNGE